AGAPHPAEPPRGVLGGLPNKDPSTPVSPFGVVTTHAAPAPDKSSTIANLTNQNLVYQISPFDYNHNILGTMVNGKGVQMGTTVQFTQIDADPQRTKLILSRPLASS